VTEQKTLKDEKTEEGAGKTTCAGVIMKGEGGLLISSRFWEERQKSRGHYEGGSRGTVTAVEQHEVKEKKKKLWNPIKRGGKRKLRKEKVTRWGDPKITQPRGTANEANPR